MRAGRPLPEALGTRWMALKGTESKTFMYRGYGIHGTIERDSIGTQASNGCVRMLNEQVEELFDIVPSGTPVLIEP